MFLLCIINVLNQLSRMHKTYEIYKKVWNLYREKTNM